MYMHKRRASHGNFKLHYRSSYQSDSLSPESDESSTADVLQIHNALTARPFSKTKQPCASWAWWAASLGVIARSLSRLCR